MTDVLGTSLERPIIWSPERPAIRSRRRPRLELLHVCSSCKKQKQLCDRRTIASEKQFFHWIISFCIGPLKVPCRSRTLGPLLDLQRTSPGRCVPAGEELRQSLVSSLGKPQYCIYYQNRNLNMLKTCEKCGVVKYCSKMSQRRHYRSHQKICDVMFHLSNQQKK